MWILLSYCVVGFQGIASGSVQGVEIVTETKNHFHIEYCIKMQIYPLMH